MICVDSSVAAKWLLIEDRTDQATALYDAALAGSEPIVAPLLLPIEVTNILRKRLRAPVPLALARAIRLLNDFAEMPVEYFNPPGLHQRALEIAHRFDLPAAYDAHYLALAEQLGCPLWTDDQRLVRTLAGRLPFVRSLSEYGSGP